MNVSVAAMPPVDVASLRRQFSDLAVDLSHTDAKLEDNQREGRYPTRGWDTTMAEYAERLDSARMQFVQVRPDASEIVDALGVDTRLAAELGGKLDMMQDHQMTFARGWDTALDRTISDVQRAAVALDGPIAPPTPPVTPPFPGAPSQVAQDAARAADLVRQSIDRIRTVPETDRGDASTKDARIAAYNLNMEAQKVLETHFQGEDAAITSQLRSADARLEDANWQLARKPSPDGRFNGVDIPGALRDSQAAVDILDELAGRPSVEA
jgi:hypothetical protein